MMKNIFTILFAMNLLMPVLRAQDANIVFPDDAGVLDVTKPPYNADNTGVVDATAAIQTALDQYPSGNRTIYLPNGTYLISNTLKWPAGTSSGNAYKRTMIQGQSKDGAIIKLKDNCEGYQDPDNRKAMIYTGPAPAQRFRNAIRGITVNTGTGNPGACGIQFNCSNEGTMQHVNIISGDGQGVYGLDLYFTNEIGPGYIYDLTVEGFDIGIMHGFAINSMTFEKITLRNQNVCGFRNGGNVSPIRGMVSENSVTAVENNGKSSTMILIDADLSGGNDTVPAIYNSGTLYARNIDRSGYNMTIESDGGLEINKEENHITEYNSHGLYHQFPSPVHSLMLPIKDWPEVPWSDLSQWANPMDYGAAGDGSANDAQAVQDAIDAGKETVYFPGGKNFKIDDTVHIRGNVRRLIGCEGRLTGSGTVVVDPDAADTVVIERINALYSSLNLINKSNHTLVLNSISSFPLESYGSGDLFIINYVPDILHLNNPDENIWVRHLNTESGDHINVENNGATLWILGFKTERGDVKIQTNDGGKTELLGVHNYSTSSEKTTPWFVIDNSSMTIAGARETNFGGYPYNEYVQEIRGTESKTLDRKFFPASGAGGGVIPLYTGYPVEGPVPQSPGNIAFNQVSAGGWELSWDAVDDPDLEYYSVYISQQSGGPYTMIGNYIDSTGFIFYPDRYTTYYFIVSSVNSTGNESLFTNEYEAVVPQPPIPSRPTGLTGYAADTANVISWNRNPEFEIDHYELYRALPPGTFFLPLASDIKDTTYIDKAISDGSVHYYSLRAVNTFNDKSDFSDTLTIYPLGNEPASAEFGKMIRLYPNPASTLLNVSWSDPSDRDGFTAIIFDGSGRECLRKTFDRNGGEMNIAGLRSGLYIIRIEDGRSRYSSRFIIR